CVAPGGLARRPNSIHDLLVVLPSVGIKFRVAVGPVAAAMKLICSRTRQDLHLPAAASHFCIDGRKNHAELADHVGVHLSGGSNAVRVPTVLNAQTVA